MPNWPNMLRALLIVPVVALSAATAQAQPLSKSEVAGLFPGKYIARVAGYTVTIKARANGALKGSALLGSDTGRWWLAGNRLCVQWRSWADGDKLCGKVRREGAWYAATGGSTSLKFRPHDAQVASASTITQ